MCKYQGCPSAVFRIFNSSKVLFAKLPNVSGINFSTNVFKLFYLTLNNTATLQHYNSDYLMNFLINEKKRMFHGNEYLKWLKCYI